MRETELYGGVLSSTLSREHLALTAEFLRGDEYALFSPPQRSLKLILTIFLHRSFFVDVLTSFLTSPKFTRHELNEYVLPAVHAESAAAAHTASTQALELAHALAFRSGLGYSLFADAELTGSITTEDVHAFQAQAVADLSNVALLGTGIAPDVLAALFEKSFAASKSAGTAAAATPIAAVKSAYHGGATRVASAHGPQTLFVGFGLSTAATPALHALSSHLSPAPALKWATGTSPLAIALPAGVRARTVLLPYSDAALFGVLFEGADASAVAQGAKAAVEVLKNAAGKTLEKEEVARSVARARFEIAGGVEARDGFVGTLGPKVLTGQVGGVQASLEAFGAVDGAAISKVAAELLKSKPTFVAVGDVHALPYGDEVGLSA